MSEQTRRCKEVWKGGDMKTCSEMEQDDKKVFHIKHEVVDGEEYYCAVNKRMSAP